MNYLEMLRAVRPPDKVLIEDSRQYTYEMVMDANGVPMNFYPIRKRIRMEQQKAVTAAAAVSYQAGLPAGMD